MGDDLVVTDDASIGGDLTVTGSFASGALALLDDQMLTVGTGSDAIIGYEATNQAPDSLVIGVGEDSRQLIIGQKADLTAGDMTIAQQTNPSVLIYSAAAAADDYLMFANDGTNSVIDSGNGVVSIIDPVTVTGDVQINGAAASLNFPDGDETIQCQDNDTTSLVIESDDGTDLMTFNTADGAEIVACNTELTVTGQTITESGTADGAITVVQTLNDTGAPDASEYYSAIDVDITTTDITGWGAANTYLMRLQDTNTDMFTVTMAGVASALGLSITGDAVLDGDAGSLQFPVGDETIQIQDADTESLVIESDDGTDLLNFTTTDNAEYVTTKQGWAREATQITDTVSLDASDCGKFHFVTDAIDTKTITLPAVSAVPDGCELTFLFSGSDGGALVDISPNANDGIEGTCTLAASVVEFSGADNADIGLTKGTANRGDMISIVAAANGDADDWFVTGCTGIWANN